MTLEGRMTVAGKATTGFDYLRIILAVAVVGWHSIFIATGSAELDARLWSGPYRFLPASIIPLFFALSGFLVAGSLLRNRLHQFVLLRILRLVPALAVEITLSALLIGLVFTTLPWQSYLIQPGFFSYFLNIVGYIHYQLPGVFGQNPLPSIVNGQLWTIPYELDCYLFLTLFAFFRLVAWRRAFLLAVLVGMVALTARAVLQGSAAPPGHAPGSVLVLSFLAAVGLYLYRDRVPYSAALGVASAVLTGVFLQFPAWSALAALPAAYLVVWLGLMTPPRIPFGDLSYGVYLFHFPIEQSAVHLFPNLQSWWQVTLASLPPTLLCAYLSWNLIENPILGHKRLVLAWVDRRMARVALLTRRPILPASPASKRASGRP